MSSRFLFIRGSVGRSSLGFLFLFLEAILGNSYLIVSSVIMVVVLSMYLCLCPHKYLLKGWQSMNLGYALIQQTFSFLDYICTDPTFTQSPRHQYQALGLQHSFEENQLHSQNVPHEISPGRNNQSELQRLHSGKFGVHLWALFLISCTKVQSKPSLSVIIPIIESGVPHCSETLLSAGQAMKRLK